MNSAQLLPAVRELDSRRPEYLYHEPWELQWMLYAVNYTDELEDEEEIAAAEELDLDDPFRAGVELDDELPDGRDRLVRALLRRFG